MPRRRIQRYVRSLLSRETLEDNLGVAVYPKILDGFRIG